MHVSAKWDLNFEVNKSAVKIQTWECSYDEVSKEKPLMIADLKHKFMMRCQSTLAACH
jgi:hypothetical protein